jgi:hypothetical protein
MARRWSEFREDSSGKSDWTYDFRLTLTGSILFEKPKEWAAPRIEDSRMGQPTAF